MLKFSSTNILNKLLSQSNIPTVSKSCSIIQSKPIPYDSVSFSASAKMPPKDKLCKPDIKKCQDISLCAEPAQYYLSKVLDEYLSPLTNSQDSSGKKKPIFKYEARVKTPVSISEKVASKYYKICNKESEQFVKQLYDGLSNNFDLNPKYTQFDALDIIRKILNKYGTTDVMTPYKFADFYFNNAIDFLKRNNVFDFNSVEPRLQEIYINNVLENIKETDSETVQQEDIFLNPLNEDGIKYYANDIVGARITMHESDPSCTKGVIDALAKAVKDGKLKITSIENNIPDKDKLPLGKNPADYEYTSVEQLQSLADLANAPLKNIVSKSGYLAIHINIDLSDPIFRKYGNEFNGYSGEIQIIGKNIEEFKELEDLCYKLKDNKKISEHYSSFGENFKKHFKSKKIEDAFEKYTYQAYLRQREIPPGRTKKDFLSISEAGLARVLPPELDFNFLKIKKSEGDFLKKADDALEKEKFYKSKTYEVRREEISRIKKDLDYRMKRLS